MLEAAKLRNTNTYETALEHDHEHGSDSHTHSTNSFSVSNGIACTTEVGISNNVRIFEENGYRIIQSNGIPNHAVGKFPNPGNPHTISEQNIRYKVTLQPKKAQQLTSIYDKPGFGIGRPSYVFGVVKNGIKLDPSAAEAFTPPNSREKNFDWNKEALSANNRLGDDCNNAHVQPNGEYHYHGTPWGYIESVKKNSMLLIGWAADGFPIYYKWIPKDANNLSSPLIEAKTSYRLRTGKRPGNGQTAPNGTYDGTYVRDFVFEQNLGDLDAANGRFGVTPEYPKGTYYYVVTDDFPSVPRYFVGTPDESFKIGGGINRLNQAQRPQPQNQSTPAGGKLSKTERFQLLDKNKDSNISKNEAKRKVLERFDFFDKNKDGVISKTEFIGN